MPSIFPPFDQVVKNPTAAPQKADAGIWPSFDNVVKQPAPAPAAQTFPKASPLKEAPKQAVVPDSARKNLSVPPDATTYKTSAGNDAYISPSGSHIEILPNGNKVVTLAKQFGGGVYTVNEKNLNQPVVQGHTDYGGVQPKKGFQRNDVIPNSQGGVNSNPDNIQYQPLGAATAQDKLETQAAKDLKSGKITLAQARAQSIQRNIDNPPSILERIGSYADDLLGAAAKATGAQDTVGKGAQIIADTIKDKNVPSVKAIAGEIPAAFKKVVSNLADVFVGVPAAVIVNSALSIQEHYTHQDVGSINPKAFGISLGNYQSFQSQARELVDEGYTPVESAAMIAANTAVSISALVGLKEMPKQVNDAALKISDLAQTKGKVRITSEDLKNILTNQTDKVDPIKLKAWKDAVKDPKAKGYVSTIQQGYLEVASKHPNFVSEAIKDAAKKPIAEIFKREDPAALKATLAQKEAQTGSTFPKSNPLPEEVQTKMKETAAAKATEKPIVEKPAKETKAPKSEIDQLREHVQAKKFNDKPAAQKRIAMEFSAIKRGLEEKPTMIETKNAKNYLERNYAGKEVLVDGEKGTVTKTAFGKVGVKFKDGTIKFLTSDLIKSPKVKNADVLAHIKDQAQKAFDQKKAENPKFKAVTETAKPEISTKAKRVPIESKSKPITGNAKSGIAKSIEAKAIENNLTKGFETVAGFDKLTFKKQAAEAAKLINSGMDNVRSIIRGEKPLPEGLRGTALIAGVEEHLKAHPNAAIAEELANSHLVSRNSEAAQELGLSRMREADSATAKLAEIKKRLTEKAGGAKVVAEKKTAVLKSLKESTNKVNLSKEELSWNKFLEEIQC